MDPINDLQRSFIKEFKDVMSFLIEQGFSEPVTITDYTEHGRILSINMYWSYKGIAINIVWEEQWRDDSFYVKISTAPTKEEVQKQIPVKGATHLTSALHCLIRKGGELPIKVHEAYKHTPEEKEAIKKLNKEFVFFIPEKRAEAHLFSLLEDKKKVLIPCLPAIKKYHALLTECVAWDEITVEDMKANDERRKKSKKRRDAYALARGIIHWKEYQMVVNLLEEYEDQLEGSMKKVYEIAKKKVAESNEQEEGKE